MTLHHPVIRLFGFTLALMMGAAGSARADTIVGDIAHSSAEFVVTHLTISRVHGTIPITSWEATTGANLIPKSVHAELNARAIDTRDTDRDKDLRSADWFDVQSYPTIAFKSMNITPGSDGSFKAAGLLSIHGTTQPVVLDGKLVGKVVDNRGRTHVGYTASTTIDRRAFKLNWGQVTPAGQLVVANEVTINLQVEGILRKRMENTKQVN